ncbi:hypothetical protein GDO86_019040 [Hymenochirus boettgeri]|uniref:EF-hand domain-containing protein n=1 Tax=Hymenochirus boettgeri TaxID=247094 RepID=A0A8T2IBB4_9PIPI|nr:hypothetical protein GDO86_019040 [Hymenochirus boettgeri]
MKDLENYDKERHNEFKRYEMLKEHERREYLKSLDEETKKLEEERFETMKKKHRDHPKINHPGSKDQLKEVWEEADGLDPNDFSAKTFFKLHDPNNDGFLDENELEALFTRELEKAYNSKNEEDDMIEMEEERLRMREHVMMEIDLNKDRLISWDEFMKYTNQKEFLEDEGWETVDEKPAFSEEELQEFERQLLENEMELKRKAHELHKQKEELVKKHEVHQALKEELNQVKQHIEEKKQQKNTPAPPVKDPSLKLQPPESAQPLSTGHLPDSGISQSLL